MNPHDDERAEQMGRAWDDLVSGTPIPGADDAIAADIAFIQQWASVPPASNEIRSTIWYGLTGSESKAMPVIVGLTAKPNGHIPSFTAQPVPTVRRREGAFDWPALYRVLAVGAIAGFAAGFGAGIWARLAMRVAGELTINRNRGFLTETDAVVGEITLGGTLFIGFFGATIGVLGGVLYVAVRHWLPRRSVPRALAYGLLLFAVFGFIVMDEHNPDYQRFGPTWLNVGTFSLAYLVFGALASLLADWLDDRLPRLSVDHLRSGHHLLRWFAMTPFALVGTLAIAFSMIAGVADPKAAIVAGLFLVSGLMHVLPRLPRLVPLELPGLQRAIGVMAIVPGLFGVWLTLQGVVGILTA